MLVAGPVAVLPAGAVALLVEHKYSGQPRSWDPSSVCAGWSLEDHARMSSSRLLTSNHARGDFAFRDVYKRHAFSTFSGHEGSESSTLFINESDEAVNCTSQVSTFQNGVGTLRVLRDWVVLLLLLKEEPHHHQDTDTEHNHTTS